MKFVSDVDKKLEYSVDIKGLGKNLAQISYKSLPNLCSSY